MVKKSLGQHWLTDKQTLEAIVEYADVKKTDTVLEIGPGLGHLTNYLLDKQAHVVAVEVDEHLAEELKIKFIGKNLSIHTDDILKFDLTQLPAGYKVVANIPYYLTSKLVRTLSESVNPPKLMVLLVQKEVAERINAKPGSMSILSVSVQLYYHTELGMTVPASLFKPPPKVDSRVIILKQRLEPLFKNLDTDAFFKVVKAGFSERRKKLRSSLSGGLAISKDQADSLLKMANVDGDLRAQNLSLKDWYRVSINIQTKF